MTRPTLHPPIMHLAASRHTPSRVLTFHGPQLTKDGPPPTNPPNLPRQLALHESSRSARQPAAFLLDQPSGRLACCGRRRRSPLVQLLQMRYDDLFSLFSYIVQLQVPLVLPQHLQNVLHVLIVVGDLLEGFVGDDFRLLQQLSEVALGDHQFVLDEFAVFALTFLSKGKRCVICYRGVRAERNTKIHISKSVEEKTLVRQKRLRTTSKKWVIYSTYPVAGRELGISHVVPDLFLHFLPR